MITSHLYPELCCLHRKPPPTPTKISTAVRHLVVAYKPDARSAYRLDGYKQETLRQPPSQCSWLSTGELKGKPYVYRINRVAAGWHRKGRGFVQGDSLYTEGREIKKNQRIGQWRRSVQRETRYTHRQPGKPEVTQSGLPVDQTQSTQRRVHSNLHFCRSLCWADTVPPSI